MSYLVYVIFEYKYFIIAKCLSLESDSRKCHNHDINPVRYYFLRIVVSTKVDTKTLSGIFSLALFLNLQTNQSHGICRLALFDEYVRMSLI